LGHTDTSLRELADRLRVRDISTVSQGEKRVAHTVRENSAAAKKLSGILKNTYSLIQA
jgi:chromosomal replication initiation ATPase DnaA